MKAYKNKITNEISLSENDYLDPVWELICERQFTDNEQKFTKLNAAGNDIEVDTILLDAYNVEQTSNQIKKIKSDIIAELDYSEIHVSNDPPYPADVSEWKLHRATLRDLLVNTTINTIIPGRPF